MPTIFPSSAVAYLGFSIVVSLLSPQHSKSSYHMAIKTKLQIQIHLSLSNWASRFFIARFCFSFFSISNFHPNVLNVVPLDSVTFVRCAFCSNNTTAIRTSIFEIDFKLVLIFSWRLSNPLLCGWLVISWKLSPRYILWILDQGPPIPLLMASQPF